MLRWQGREPTNFLSAIESDFDALFASFLGTSNDLSFLAFKRVWSQSNMSLVHQCHPRRADPRLFIQAIFHAILQRLHHLPCGWDEVNGQATWERNGSKFPLLASLQYNESRETVWNIAVLYTLYCLYGTQIPITSTNVTITGDNAVLQIQPIRIDPMLFLELNLAVDRIAMVDLPVAMSASGSSSRPSLSSSSSSSSSSSTGTVGRGVLHLFHRLFYTLDAFSYSLHAGPANLNTVALAQSKTLAPLIHDNDHDIGDIAGSGNGGARSSGSVRLRQIAEMNEKLRGHRQTNHSNDISNGSSGSSSSSSSSSNTTVSAMLAAMNADIAAVYHGGAHANRRVDMTGVTGSGVTASMTGGADTGNTGTGDTGGTDDAVSGVGINAAAGVGTGTGVGTDAGVSAGLGVSAAVTTNLVPTSSSSSFSANANLLAERKQQVTQERIPSASWTSFLESVLLSHPVNLHYPTLLTLTLTLTLSST